MEWINSALKGKEPLWKVFWRYTFIPAFGAFVIGGIIHKLDDGDAALTVRHLFWLKLILLPYMALCSYLVFQCLHNIQEANSSLYARMAMIFCIFWTLWLLQSVGHGPYLPPPAPPKPALIKGRPIPKPDVDVRPAAEQAAHDECVRTMHTYALNNHVDPQKYVSSNQSYLQKCTEYLMNKNVQPDKR